MSVALDPTAEEKAEWLEHVKRACIDDEAPDPEKMPGFAAPRPEAAPAPRPGAGFSTADLDGSDLAACRRYPMPGGKELWIFALSGDETRKLALWSSRIDPGFHKDDNERARQAKIEAALQEARGIQVALCCYQDAERRQRCFQREDVDRILTGMRGERIKAICAISDELAGEGVEQGPGDLHAFFVTARACFAEWLSASDGWDDCPALLRDRTRALISRWQPSI